MDVKEMNLSESTEATPFHHLLELLEIDHAVSININLGYHVLAVLDGSALLQAEGGQDGPQLVDGDEAVGVLVEDVEGLPHVLLLVALVHDGLVELPELVDVDAAIAVDVNPLDHLAELLVRNEDAKILQRVVQLLLRYSSVAVAVEHLEHALQLVGVHCCSLDDAGTGRRRRRRRRCSDGFGLEPRRGEEGTHLLGDQTEEE